MAKIRGEKPAAFAENVSKHGVEIITFHSLFGIEWDSKAKYSMVSFAATG